MKFEDISEQRGWPPDGGDDFVTVLLIIVVCVGMLFLVFG